MIVTQPKDLIGQWVAEKCGLPNAWGGFSALADIDERGIRVGVIYNHFFPVGDRYHDCYMSVAARDGCPWAQSDFLSHAFEYPFIQLGCERVTAAIERNNIRSRRLCERLGFEYEGEKLKGTPNDDIVFYRLFKQDWINEQTRRARSA